MKKSLFFAALLFTAAPEMFAQWQVTGGYVGVNSTTNTFKCTGEIRVGSGATFKNLGKTFCSNLKTDAGGTARGTGLYTLSGSLVNNGALLDNIKFTLNTASVASITSTGDPIYQLTLSKTGAGITVTLNDPLTITNKLTLSGANNKLSVGNHDLTFGPSAVAIGTPTSTKYIVTGGTGRVIKQNLGSTSYFFPIGATATTYNPLTLSNAGTVDNIGARALPDALSSGDTGSPLTSDAVAASWQITEGTVGGSNLTVTTNWLTADELPGFDRTACAVRRWNGTVWDSSPLGAATGSGTAAAPYQRVRAGITSDGYFAVLDGAYPLPPTAIRGDEALELELFPNPATEQVFVRADFPGAETLHVFDMAGREVLFLEKPAVVDGLWLDVSRLAEGAYFVKISDGVGETLNGNFVKTR